MKLLRSFSRLFRTPRDRRLGQRADRPHAKLLLEELESRLAPSTVLPSTLVAGSSVGQSITSVVSTSTASSGLLVQSTTNFTSPSGFLLLSQASTQVTGLVITAVGSHFIPSVGGTLLFSGGGGTGATGTYTTNSTGNLKNVTLTNPGSGYTSSPTVTFQGPVAMNATGAAVTASINSTLALLNYNAVTPSGATTPGSFNTLALPAGDGSAQLTSSTIVSQAANGATAAGNPQSLSATPFTLKMATQPNDFLQTGYIYVQGGHANYIIHYGSNTDTSDGATTFGNCTIVGSAGVLSANPYTDVVNAGAFVVQAAAPPAGTTTSTNTSPIQVTAGKSFTLPVLSTQFGFFQASPTSPGALLVYYTTGAATVVSYTGTTATSFTGCIAQASGTIGTLGADSNTGPVANVQRTANSPIQFTFTNNTQQGLPVYLAIAGQAVDQSGTPTFGYLTPQSTGGKPDLTKKLQFVPINLGVQSLTLQNGGSGFTPNSSGTLTFTSASGSGAAGIFTTNGSGAVNSVTLTAFGSGYTSAPTVGFAGIATVGTGAAVQVTLPPAVPSSVPYFTLFAPANPINIQSISVTNSPVFRLSATRIIFSVGLPPVIPISSGAPNFPAPGNPTDPDNAINYDFVEFTERSAPNDGVLFINTTQVDQVGLPFTMQTTPPDSIKTNGVGILDARAKLPPDYQTYVKNEFLSTTGTVAQNASAAFQNLVTSYRLLNPSDAISNPPSGVDVSALESYFDSALTSFFTNYSGANSFRLQRDGYYFVGQTLTSFAPPTYTSQATYNGTALLIPASSGTTPAAISLEPGELVSGPGITGQTTISSISVAASGLTTVTLNGPVNASPPVGSNAYTFSVPGVFTVLQLQEADSTFTPQAGKQQYQIYAPYFVNPSNPTEFSTSYPTNFPAGTGLGGVLLVNGGTGFTASSSGTFTFSGGGATTNASGIFTTNAGGAINSVALTNFGAGYTSMPTTVNFAGIATVGTGASLQASFVPAAPPWIAPASAGEMVFGNLGAFADGTFQANAAQISGANATAQILLDVENTIVSAFNRGVANAVPAGQDVTSPWDNNATFYQAALQNGTNWSNYYAGFLHNGNISVTAPGSSVGLAYGFAYDDQGGNDPTLASIFPSKVAITLKTWAINDSIPGTPLKFTTQPQGTASTPVTFTLQGLPSTDYRVQPYQIVNGAYTAFGTPVLVHSNTSGVLQQSKTNPITLPAGQFVLVVMSNNAGEAFGSQYSVSTKFTVAASSVSIHLQQSQTPTSQTAPAVSSSAAAPSLGDPTNLMSEPSAGAGNPFLAPSAIFNRGTVSKK